MLTSSSAFAAIYFPTWKTTPDPRMGFLTVQNMWCVWLENLDLDFEFATTYEIQNGSYTEKLVFVFPFTFLLLKTGLKKTAHKNSDLARAYIICRKNKYKKVTNPLSDFQMKQ